MKKKRACFRTLISETSPNYKTPLLAIHPYLSAPSLKLWSVSDLPPAYRQAGIKGEVNGRGYYPINRFKLFKGWKRRLSAIFLVIPIVFSATAVL